MNHISIFEHLKNGVEGIVISEYRRNKDDLSINPDTETTTEFLRRLKAIRRYRNNVNSKVLDLIRTYESDLSKDEILKLDEIRGEMLDNYNSN